MTGTAASLLHANSFEKALNTHSAENRGEPATPQEATHSWKEGDGNIKKKFSVIEGSARQSVMKGDSPQEMSASTESTAYNTTLSSPTLLSYESSEYSNKTQDDEDDVDPDSCIPKHEGPTYVMEDKLKEINAALQQEPPPDENRQRIIAFNEKVTEVMLPSSSADSGAPDMDETSREAAHSDAATAGLAGANQYGPDILLVGPQGNGSIGATTSNMTEVRETNDNNNGSARSYTAEDDERGTAADIGNNLQGRSSRLHNFGPKSRSAPDDDEKVLVEMEGKFELLSMKELQSLGYALPLKDDWDIGERAGGGSLHGSEASDILSGSIKSDTAATSAEAQPRPPLYPRPATAAARSSHGGNDLHVSARQRRGQPQRAHSASAWASQPYWGATTYRSPYALTLKQREMKEKREVLLQETQKSLQQRQKEEERLKKEQNEEAFQYWLKKKKEEAAAARQKNGGNDVERNDHTAGGSRGGDKEEESSSVFQEWIRAKRVQYEAEKLLQKRKEQEEAEGYLLRTRDDCERAYNAWLSKKEKEIKGRKAEELSKMRVRKIGRKMSRKALKLTKAIRDARSFRYVDYYGYRF